MDDHHFGYITESFTKRIMGPNCLKHIVIVLETFCRFGQGNPYRGGPDCTPLLPQEYRRILFFVFFGKSFQIWYVERFAKLFSGWLHHEILRKNTGTLGY